MLSFISLIFPPFLSDSPSSRPDPSLLLLLDLVALCHPLPPRIGGEALPQPEGLVSSGGDQGAAVGGEREVEDALGVAKQLSSLQHGGVLPDDNLWE